MERRLAAILIADVVGYGRLSQIDEEGTRAQFQADLKEVFEPKIATYHGRLIKTMGDGLLAEFSSIVDALRCALEAQQSKAKRNLGVPPTHRLDFRIGVNLGDVIVEGEDIHGDGVNIADRLQALAQPGGVAISGTVYDQVKAKLPVGYISLGEQKVKSIADPVRVYRLLMDPADAGKTVAGKASLRFWRIPAAAAAALVLALAAAAWWQPWRPANEATVTAVDTRPSLVVLPFDNLSDDKEQGYLADGISEDLTTELARVPGLFVISRNAAFTYKGKPVKPAQIAKELGVRYILEGSTRRLGDDMRLNAQLIDAKTGGHIWAERFDGQWADVFALQDKVIASIAGALKLRLMTGQDNAEIAGGTSNPDAYDAYLRGLELNAKGLPEDIVKAVASYQRALALDPDFGAVSAELAWIYWDLDDQRAKALGLSWDKYEEIEAKTYEYLEKAAKHPSPSYYQLIAFLLIRERKSDEAIDALQKALALNPSDPGTLLNLSHALSFNGRPRDGRAYLDAALRVDPGWTEFHYYRAGLAAFGDNHFEDAILLLEKIDPRSPNPWPKFYGLQLLLSAYGHLGNNAKIADTKKNLETVLTERNESGMNLLLTQQYFVFKHEADIERLLEGLRKAGVGELPAHVKLDPKDRLTGPEIKSLIVGHELRGRQIVPEAQEYGRTMSADGSMSVAIGPRSNTGTSWVQGDFLCDALPRRFTRCGAVFRNQLGTFEQKNEYLSIYRENQFAFSVVK